MKTRLWIVLLMCVATAARGEVTIRTSLSRALADALYAPLSRSVATTAPLGGGGDLSADRTLTCTTCATSANNLSFFSPTTSAQLLGVISDETGSGALVFAGGNIGAATGTSLTLTNASGGGVVTTSGSGTNQAYYQITNTGGAFILGVDSSVGGNLFVSGVTAYDTVLTTQTATGLTIAPALTRRWRFLPTGPLIATADNSTASSFGDATHRSDHYGFKLSGGAESGSNIAGTALTISADTGTGNTTPSRVHINAPASGTASGSTVHTSVDRLILNGTKALSNNSNTAIANFALASDTGVATIVSYAVEVNDGASHHQQVEIGRVSCSAVNSNGAFSANTCTKFGNQQSISASGGTLTVTWTITAANPAVLTLNSNTATITPTLIRVTYSIENLTQQAVTPQ